MIMLFFCVERDDSILVYSGQSILNSVSLDAIKVDRPPSDSLLAFMASNGVSCGSNGTNMAGLMCSLYSSYRPKVSPAIYCKYAIVIPKGH